MERDSDLLAYLEELGTGRMPHSGRTLLHHLEGTGELVASWGLPPPVVRAALCHSLYGTQYYRRSALNPEDREKLRQRIGNDVERLVFLFHAMDRGSLFSGEGPRGLKSRDGCDLRVTPSEFESLVHIMVANNIEQNRGSDFLSRCRLVGMKRDWQRIERYLNARAIAEVERIRATARVPWPLAASVRALSRFVTRPRRPERIDPPHPGAT